jgi:hypothetical protein
MQENNTKSVIEAEKQHQFCYRASVFAQTVLKPSHSLCQGFQTFRCPRNMTDLLFFRKAAKRGQRRAELHLKTPLLRGLQTPFIFPDKACCGLFPQV